MIKLSNKRKCCRVDFPSVPCILQMSKHSQCRAIDNSGVQAAQSYTNEMTNQLTSRSSSPSSSSTSSSPASTGVDKADALLERPRRSFRSFISSNFASAALSRRNRAIQTSTRRISTILQKEVSISHFQPPAYTAHATFTSQKLLKESTAQCVNETDFEPLEV